MKKSIYFLGVIAVVLAAAWLVTGDRHSEQAPEAREAAPLSAKSRVAASAAEPKDASAAARSAKGTESAEPAEECGDPPQTDEERREAENEALVEAFDALTDRWMEPAEKGVAMADVDAFVRQFKKVPADRREECLQRALNLVPDENVMLLAGVLMDKTQPKELVELVFNDVLNRDEDVKRPILHQLFKDKSHPCWADTAWILDVTGDESVKSPSHPQ